MPRIKHLISLLWISLFTGGCALNPVPSMQEQGPTTLDIYMEHMNSASSTTPLKRIDVDRHLLIDQKGTERTISSEFPRFLRNPTLHMYVFPHLATEDQVPIPGYWTVFKLYATDHYALPGEI